MEPYTVIALVVGIFALVYGAIYFTAKVKKKVNQVEVCDE